MGSNPSKIKISDSTINSDITRYDEYQTTVKPKQYEFVCTTCARENKHANASNLCTICKDYLCFKCLQVHCIYRSGHVEDMVGLDEMRKLGVQGPTVMPKEKCVTHGGEVWTMFCPKDGVAGCKWCMQQDHRYACNLQFEFVISVSHSNACLSLFIGLLVRWLIIFTFVLG